MAKRRKQSTNKKNLPKVYDVPVQLGLSYDIPIVGLGSSGEGVGRYEDYTVFVPYALPGEVVRANITLVKKTYAKARLESVIKPSKHRIEPNCFVYGDCGGCKLQHVNYEHQKEMKTQMVRDIIERIAKNDPSLVLSTLGPTQPWNYRNKMQVPVGGIQGDLKMGFYSSGSHEIVHCLDCVIQEEQNNEITRATYKIAQELGIPPYDEHSGQGILRHVIGRVGRSGELMVILVTATDVLPRIDEWITKMRKALPNLASLVQNINTQRNNVIMGDKNNFIWGKKQIEDKIGNLKFLLSPHSFFQINPEQTEILYNKALEYADLQGGETVIDAYCGTGTISLFLAQKAKRVIGIEIVEPAIIDARHNAERNGFDNAEFIVGDAAKVMPKLYKFGVRADVVVFDPIRAGCKEPVLESAMAMKPKRIVYVSCNPASMARDIKMLEREYKLVKVQPVDMFPMTSHVETVALLTKLDVDKHISVEVTMDEVDLTSAESKATY